MTDSIYTYTRDSYTISTDKTRLDVDRIYQYLSEEAYWSPDIPRDIVERGIANALCYGVYEGDKQAGFARVITDYATFAYIADVFILPDYRRQGLSKWLMETVVAHPELQTLRRWMLLTRDAHDLYQNYAGFSPISIPSRHMERINMNIYQELKAQREAVDQKTASMPHKS